ncbi:MAG: putative DnaG family primase [crAssphage sp. isolate ctcc615]|uniref:DnaG family primase n=1 Tax=crAssphage sp. isolate ctcc615 TaxID=2989853 RepID=A0A345BP35_9CAUD|nr:MAG: DNA primase [crAssphage sp. isolate ctcc615]AXF52206.1 MAG: putative DnaG family primase [crAssphage sp. isolate ctcc615]
MIRNVNTTRLTKSYIESKISQELIVSKYLDIPLSVIKDCIENNTLITSVFRDNDTNKSMGIKYNNKRRLKIRDFGGFGFFGDVYDVVAYVLSLVCKRKIEPNNKQDFYFILKHIANTFSDIIENKKVDENITNEIKDAISIGKQRRPIIEIVPRSWNKQDKEYWNNLGISLNYLNTHFVIPVEQYYIDRGVNTEPKYYYKHTDPCYAYMLGQNRIGIQFIKLYFPKRKRDVELKFITNCNVLEGLINLELNNYDYILITKSSKDRLSIGSCIDSTPFYRGGRKLNIGIINLPSENYRLNEKEYTWIVNKLAIGGKIISLLDFDYTGRHGAKYLYSTYNIPYIFITRGEFGLPDYGCKDFAELWNKYTKEEINQFINETITYVELRFNNERDSSSDYTTLPYFE